MYAYLLDFGTALVREVMLCYNPWHVYFKYLLGEAFYFKAGKEIIDCVALAPKSSSPGLAVHVLYNWLCGVNPLCFLLQWLSVFVFMLFSSPAPLEAGSAPALHCCWVSRSQQWSLCVGVCIICTGEKWPDYQWMHHELTECTVKRRNPLKSSK